MDKRKKTSVYIETIKYKQSLTIAKRKGIAKFSSLVNILVSEYVEKNRELLPEHLREKDLEK